MGPHSLIGASSDGGSQVLWEDGERVFRRGWRPHDNGKRAVLLVMPAAEHPSRSSLDRLTHEYELRDELDGAWAVIRHLKASQWERDRYQERAARVTAVLNAAGLPV